MTTDLYTRGIDIRTVNIVINFDVPMSVEDYLHRIGRCGRFGHRGLAITFYTTSAEERRLFEIDSVLDSPMKSLPTDISKIPAS